MLVVAFAAFFAFIIAYNRLEFVISKDEAWQAAQDKDKAAALLQDVTSQLQGARWRWRCCRLELARLGLPELPELGMEVAQQPLPPPYLPCPAASHPARLTPGCPPRPPAALGDAAVVVDTACDAMTASSVDSAAATKAAVDRSAKGTEDAVRAGLAALEASGSKQAGAVREALDKAGALQVRRRAACRGCPALHGRPPSPAAHHRNRQPR
jgi:hypothetical protein